MCGWRARPCPSASASPSSTRWSRWTYDFSFTRSLHLRSPLRHTDRDGLMVAPLVLFGVAGAVMIYAGVSMRRTAPIDDPGAYLRSLDDYEEVDEFQQLLSEPFLARVLRPIGSRALGAISSVLPANYLDSIRLKLLFSGLAGRYRPEEIVTAQVLLAAVGCAVGVGYSVLIYLSTGLVLMVTVGLPVLGAFSSRGELTSALKSRPEQ